MYIMALVIFARLMKRKLPSTNALANIPRTASITTKIWNGNKELASTEIIGFLPSDNGVVVSA